MSLLQQIKQDQIQARKDKQKDTASILTTLYSEAAMVGKNNGNRETNDSEVKALIKKFIKGIDETLEIRPNEQLEHEKEVLQQYLPKQLTEDELEGVIRGIVESLEDKSPKAIGTIMKTLKGDYDGQFDGKQASNIAKRVLSE